MKLKDLIKDFEYSPVKGELDKEISEIVYDSRKICKDCLFVCVKGANFDGHTAAMEASQKGAAALIVEKEVITSGDITVIKVDSTRYAMAYIASAQYDHPSKKLKMIGITGTKGKTTTTYLIKSILENSGYKVGLIGTIEVIIGDKHIPAKNTTPESYVLQAYLDQMVKAGIDAVVMEVSSQGLMLHRTAAIDYDIGIFTNIEPDHIGPNEHKDFEHYMYCKSLLFKQCRIGILNGDDKHVDSILKDHTCRIEKFGLNEGADIRAVDIKLINGKGFLGVSFRTEGLMEIEAVSDTPGVFSVYNSLCAIAVCRHFNIDEKSITKALKEAKVKGRIEMIPVSDKFTLMIDYAHNAMALESLLKTLKEYSPKRLICLFGCGGNRSKLRRYDMGEVSGRLSDLTVITSDNPRDEDPMDIIKDIETGISKTSGRYISIPDRKEAIRYVITHGDAGDIIVLAGKGHEDYQEIKGIKYPMDERVLIKEIMQEEHLS
ncbi:MAG: UDP-N-acetylmuramoyl-L-alanyl-D-glutamate--2,6-diaminopimelate ligase [Lachnospiraceae bacterium]|nr:UDP-N-acetylmuramoyl-L-alanyl-D-glutamate--2,6-diaminopimelate ligase [Lachnospiraceae bacterium]